MEAYRKIKGGRTLLYVCGVFDDYGTRDGACRPIGDRPTAGAELNFVFSLRMAGVIEGIDANLRRLIDRFVVKVKPKIDLESFGEREEDSDEARE